MFGTEGKKKKAVTYYRHSAEDKQENSVPLQRQQAQQFADKYDIEIIHEEADEGKSGITALRPGFARLFDNWVLSDEAPEFDYILVLDESRWGRFQDTDEAAYWEMQCKKRDKKVIYITRGFPKEEDKLITSLQTSIFRYMSGEYVQKLSDNVWLGSAETARQGFSPGGTAPYGYTRVLFDEQKNRIGALKPGEHKSISNQRVNFEPATDGTQDIVRKIYRLFLKDWLTPAEIAQFLNDENVLSAAGKTWDSSKILKILCNETYTGTRIYNKTWHRLKRKQRKNPVEEWVRCENAFEGLVSHDDFKLVQERLYWTMPSKWKHGIYRINQTKASLNSYVKEILDNYDEDKLYWTLKKLPVTFGLTYYEEGVGKRCFRITEDMRRYTEVMGFSINMFVKDKIDAVFTLPVSKFGIGQYLVLRDDDQQIDELKINDEQAREKVLELCKAVKV